MQVVVDSDKFKKLVFEINGLQQYTEGASPYSEGVRDGRNETIEQIVAKLEAFWRSVTM
jgi:hypothetical protein